MICPAFNISLPPALTFNIVISQTLVTALVFGSLHLIGCPLVPNEIQMNQIFSAIECKQQQHEQQQQQQQQQHQHQQ